LFTFIEDIVWTHHYKVVLEPLTLWKNTKTRWIHGQFIEQESYSLACMNVNQLVQFTVQWYEFTQRERESFWWRNVVIYGGKIKIKKGKEVIEWSEITRGKVSDILQGKK
jgi:hypothetical protein